MKIEFIAAMLGVIYLHGSQKMQKRTYSATPRLHVNFFVESKLSTKFWNLSAISDQI